MNNRASPSFPLESVQLYHACRSDNQEQQAAAFRTLWNYLLPILTNMVHTQPDANDFAEDCAQQTLIRVYERYHECHDPAAFLQWSRRVARNLTIDELRRRGRFTALPTEDSEASRKAPEPTLVTTPEGNTLAALATEDLRILLEQSPMSERSRRVVIGRFIDDVSDEVLAEIESGLGDSEVLPSHVQVTRAKNLTKLRDWSTLQSFLVSENRKTSM